MAGHFFVSLFPKYSILIAVTMVCMCVGCGTGMVEELEEMEGNNFPLASSERFPIG